MKRPQSVKALEDLGRVQLSPSFFMRDFLYSEISQIEGIPNIPDDPDTVIRVGKELCLKVLEPIQQKFGRISIRSAYRSCAVNAKGAENKNQYNCASNEKNYARHIWDVPDQNGHFGAMACIVVNRFLPYYERTKHWEALAWWIHDNVPGYSSMYFFPRLAAFNIGWHENPEKTIHSYAPPVGCLTRSGMENYIGSHESLGARGERPMTQVSRSSDCGNSPKNKMAEDIAIALETRDTDFLSQVLDSEANWNHVGGTETTAEAILKQVGLLNTPTSLAIDHAISHGKVGAVSGSVEQGTSKQRFCHVIEFTSVKCNRVRRIESYGG